MLTYNVTRVHKETVSKDGRPHEHIGGVITDAAVFYSNQQVVDMETSGRLRLGENRPVHPCMNSGHGARLRVR